MACLCHKTEPGIAGVNIVASTSPVDQCAACAQKHVLEAWGLWKEHSYQTVNRRWILANLRAVVSHTSTRWPDIADKARDLFHVIQFANDSSETDAQWTALMDAIDAQFQADNPGVPDRLAELAII